MLEVPQMPDQRSTDAANCYNDVWSTGEELWGYRGARFGNCV